MLLLLIITLFPVAFSQGIPCDDVVPCPEGSSCHPNQGLCYEDPEPTDKLHVWLEHGLTPRCDRKPSDCAYFDMDYDISHIHGGGSWCNEGMKIRCLVRDPPEQNDPTPANQLQVVAYNIFERGWYITIDGQRERTCRMPKVFAAFWPDVDVIAFQEVFMGGCWPSTASLRDILKLYGFPYSTKTVSSPFKPENGGIFVASRWPILEEDQTVFRNADNTSWDIFAAKGVSYAKIEKTVNGESRIYHVGSSHFQAGGPMEVKYGQGKEWADFFASKNFPQNEPVIFAGDLNTNYWATDDSWTNLMEILGTAEPVLSGNINASANPIVNDLLKLKGSTGWGSWIDHVLYDKNHLTPTSYSTEILIAKDPEPMAVCWCEECINPLRFDYVYPEAESGCKRIEYVQSIGDHQPVLGYFEFP